jgi:signal transduction histidine kinase
MQEIMEPFGQVTDPQLNKGQGTGLGLPIAKAMMKMHGGELHVTSTVDQGTTVQCAFPKERVCN